MSAADNAIVSELLRKILADKVGEGIQPLEHYQKLFDGHEELVAREYAGLALSEGRQPVKVEGVGVAGSRIGPYVLERRLGSGGQAVVYLAHDPRLDRRVALKVVSGTQALGTTARDRFVREAEATARLEHPGICPVYDFGQSDGLLYIAMRYIEGDSLDSRINSARQISSPSVVLEARTDSGSERSASHDTGAPIPAHDAVPPAAVAIDRILAFFEQAALALHEAHEQGLIHRDLKPANLMVDREGRAVLLDFGLVQESDGHANFITITGEALGTPAYLSPEQLTAKRIRLDHRTDVYSLGVSLYECLTLRRPFERATIDQLYQAILSKAPPNPRAINSTISKDLATVLEIALAKDRDHRYGSAADLAEDLRRVREHEPLLGKPPGRLTRLIRWSERRPAVAALSALSILLVIALIVGSLTFASSRTSSVRKLSTQSGRIRELVDWKKLREIKADLELRFDRIPLHSASLPALRNIHSEADELLASISEKRTRLSNGNDGDLTEVHALWPPEETARLLAELETFAPKVDEVERRIVAIEDLRSRSGDAQAELWRRCCEAIAASPRYGGLRIGSQFGLVPLMADPESGLFEFLHLATHDHDPPPRRVNRRLHLQDNVEIGVVLVLIPAASDGKPPNEPYFISKYETTQGQWIALTGENPSEVHLNLPNRSGDRATLLHPVERVSHRDVVRVLRGFDLRLPNRHEWNHAARAGTSGPWSTGESASTLVNRANIAFSDKELAEATRLPTQRFATHGPVDSFEANAFGVYQMHGNVAEWIWGIDREPRPSGLPKQRGLRVNAVAPRMPFKGGSYRMSSDKARWDAVTAELPQNKMPDIGFRCARSLDK